MFAVSMPNADTSFAAVDTATKCFATASLPAPSPLSSHSRAVAALVIVSSVVKVLLATMNSVSAGSQSRVFSKKSLASTLETNRQRMPWSAKSASAS